MPKSKKLIVEAIKELSIYKCYVQIVFTSTKAAQNFWNDLTEVEEDCTAKNDKEDKICYHRVYEALLEGAATYWGKFSDNDVVKPVLLRHAATVTKLTTLDNVHGVAGPSYDFFEKKCESLPSGNYCIGFENNKFSVWKRIPYKKLKAMWDKE